MTKRILSESGTIVRDTRGGWRVCLLTEGQGSSADYPRTFFNEQNAAVLRGALSFPNHPKDYDKPEERDPMSVIGRIGDTVTIEEHDGKVGFWSTYHPSSRPGVNEHLEQFAESLALSVFCEGDTKYNMESGREEAVAFDPTDPYKSVDLVIVGGRGGKFEKRLAESHRRLTETSAPAEENKEETKMDKDIEERFNKLSTDFATAIGDLAKKLDGKAEANAQAQADQEAVDKAVDERLGEYDKAVDLISEAKLTESQSSDLRARARKGEDITGAIETAKKVLAEAQNGRGGSGDDSELHLGGGGGKSDDLTFDVPGFGKVSG